MAGSLLAYLFPRIRGSQEDVATLSLSYLLKQSDILRAAFTKTLSLHLHLFPDTSIHYDTQVTGQQKERPDIVGTDITGTERIICEAKFFAALTENQPNGYLKRLDHVENSGLIFLCPQSRLVGLWKQVVSLVPGDVEYLDDYCVKTTSTHVSVISWTEVLDTLLLAADRSAPETKDDLLQLIGFCKEMENTSFVPFKAEDLGADIAKSVDRYYMVVDSTTELLLHQKKYEASKKGLRATPLWEGHVQYIRVDDLCLGIYFNRELWKKDSSVYTPFWLSIGDSSWKQSEFVIAYLNTLPARQTERSHDGHLLIAMDTPVGCTLEETANALASQVLKHVEACESFMKT